MSKKLVFILLFITMGHVKSLFSYETTPKDYIISSGKAACATDQESFKCWGEPPKIPINLKNPSQVSFDFWGAGCAIQNGEAVCWNEDGSLDEVPSEIVKPTQVIRTYGGYSCALMNSRVKCWDKRTEPYEIKELGNVRSLYSTLGSQVCALDNEGVTCWELPNNIIPNIDGTLDNGIRFKIKIKSLKQVASYYSKLCILREGEVKCWDLYNDKELSIPSLLSENKPRKIALNDHYICSLNDEGVYCWQRPDTPGTRKFMKYRGLKGLKDFLKSIKAPRDISLGDDHICVLDHTEVKCLGLSVPLAKDGEIKEIYTGRGYTCYRDETGMKCFGQNEFKQLNIPYKIGKIKKVSTSYSRICLVDENGDIFYTGKRDSETDKFFSSYFNPIAIDCSHGELAVIDNNELRAYGLLGLMFSNVVEPTHLSINNIIGHSCIIDEGRVKCFTESYYDKVPIPEGITNPLAVGVGLGSTCVLDGSTVKCAGDQIAPRHLTQVSGVSFGSSHSCAINNGNVECWSEEDFRYPEALNVPEGLINPIQVSADGLGHTCALDDEGIKCWGLNDHGQAPAFVKRLSKVTLGGNSPDVFDMLRILENNLVLSKSQIIKDLNLFLQKNYSTNVSGKLSQDSMLLSILKPLVSNSDSIFMEDFKLIYQEAADYLNKSEVIDKNHSFGKRTLVKALILELKVAQNFFSIDQRRNSLEVLKNAVALFNNINSKDKTKMLVKSIKDKNTLWASLQSNHKSKFLGDMIHTASKLIEERLQ